MTARGARGLLFASQICVGNENDLRIRVWGTKGGLEWHQENPNHLVMKRLGEPEVVMRRGNDYLGKAAASFTRLPSGHPEAFFEAFANVYRAASDAIRAKAGANGGATFDYPDISHGARGVRFIEKAVESARNGAAWTTI